MHLIIFAFLFITTSANDEETNKLTSTASTNLDSNLRKALLKALTELEAESDNVRNPESSIEKAQASQISFIQENSQNSTTLTTTTKSPLIKKQIVLIQKSAGIQSKPITTFIPTNANVTGSFLTSSTSFTGSKYEKTTPKPNSITINDKLTTIDSKKKDFYKIDLTSPTPTVETPTTEESEAKVEDVQFFSAPLVAAFTVHQDEHGLPKSVEPIFKASTNTVPVVTNFIDDQRFYQHQQQQEFFNREQQKQEELKREEEKLREREEFLKQQQLKQEQFRNQLAIQEKQRALEVQLYKLQHQQRQQQEVLLKQQELIREQEKVLREERERNRLKQNEQPFIPIIPNNHIENVEFTTSKPSTVVFQSSVSFNPVEFSKSSLPLSAQQLPVKNYNDFQQTPFYKQNQIQQNQEQSQFHANQIQQNQFQQNQIQHNQIQQNQLQQSQLQQNQIQTNQQQPNPFQQNQIQTIQSIQPIQPVHTIQPIQNVQSLQPIQQIQPILTPPHHFNIPSTTVEIPPTQNVRIYRQEHDSRNFENNNFGFNPNQQQQLQQQQQYVQIQPSIQVPNVRLLRSNEVGFQNGPVQPPLVNHHLRNLLHQAGISKGRQEDLNIVSKVLSYNHFGGGGNNFFTVPARAYQFQVHRSDTKG